ncbi:Acetyltransferase (isoleucine patch superfamily) [Mucilaginibacter gossypiicola]|uniref:Acetyltransferase (Isoleucine patch superfamily) n=1 Tax=Mucilaginibacter gossypiicola TaxID=551995 RepID=A0A1H8AKP5_9SPHI|nr:acyltransferase [Mucilaginibacter gossypiicola]SEM71310.1 Acetyltransferase (isoleucine patch superfamily) [Mucilaginibacter gossypiicola]
MKRLLSIIYYLIIYPYYKLAFKHIGYRSKIVSPLKIEGYSNISIGSRVNIEYKTWLAAFPHTGAATCNLIIGDGTNIGHFNHIYATESITIGKNVLIADKVYISDNLHSYDDISLPVSKQPIKQLKAVNIGDGTWLGENVCVIGSSIGKGCVIGANSVVTKDIPDYCVAVGSPARIIKKYDAKSGTWLKTSPDGTFIIH